MLKQLSKINFILLLLISVYLILSNTYTTEKKATDEFNTFYKIHAINTPAALTFADKNIPLNDFDVVERYDREILTNVYWQSQTLMLLKRANRYFPTIEKILKANNIPDDFKYVALAESGLQNVVSPANAAGFWQFLDKTGKRYGLEITEEVDERYHLEKATLAACKYFKEAYNQFNDWSLVAASYNMGIEGVKRQIQSQKVNTYFDLYLNTETSRYLFRVLSLKSIHQNPTKYGFYITYNQSYQPITTVIAPVNLSISNLQQWSLDQNCNYKLLKLLNPWLRKSYINIPEGKTYYIQLPKYRITNTELTRRLKNDTLYLAESGINRIIKEDVMPVVEHKVLAGETLEIIAADHQVTVEQLVKWNNIVNNKITINQVLKIKQGIEE